MQEPSLYPTQQLLDSEAKENKEKSEEEVKVDGTKAVLRMEEGGNAEFFCHMQHSVHIV